MCACLCMTVELTVCSRVLIMSQAAHAFFYEALSDFSLAGNSLEITLEDVRVWTSSVRWAIVKNAEFAVTHN